MRNTHKFGRMAIPMPIILYLAFTIHVTLADNYVPTEKILLNCGGASNDSDTDGQKWTTYIWSKYLLASGKTIASQVATQEPSNPQVPCMIAQVFYTNFTYKIPVVPSLNLFVFTFILLPMQASMYSMAFSLSQSGHILSLTTLVLHKLQKH